MAKNTVWLDISISDSKGFLLRLREPTAETGTKSIMEKESHSGVERPLNTLHSPRTPMEEMFCHFFLKAEEIFKPFFGRNEDCPIQRAINRFEEIINDIRSKYSIDDVCTGDFGEIGVGSQSDLSMVQDALPLPYTNPSSSPSMENNSALPHAQSPSFDMFWSELLPASPTNSHTPSVFFHSAL